MTKDRFCLSPYNDTDINEEYFLYLCRLVGVNFGNIQPLNRYRELLELLFNYEFYWVVEMDANRIEDTKTLKDDFRYNTNYINYDQIYSFCSVLEILIVLATAMNDKIESLGVPYWFWQMISNLDICYKAKDPISPKRKEEILETLRIFVERKYGKNGLLFPLQNPSKDQRKVELWYQMNEYYNENF